MKPSLPSFLLLGACALGLLGCTDLDDADSSADTAVRSEGPLTAQRGAAFGQVHLGSATQLGLRLDNAGRSEIIIRQITVVPPDPYAPAFVPPDPCYPPDPYHNPPAYLTTRLLAPCVMPTESRTLSLALSPSDTGGFAAGILIEYATADGAAYKLTVPATACVVR